MLRKNKLHFLKILFSSFIVVFLWDIAGSTSSIKIQNQSNIWHQQNYDLPQEINFEATRGLSRQALYKPGNNSLSDELKSILKNVNIHVASGNYPQAIQLIKDTLKLDINKPKISGFLEEKLGNLLYKSNQYPEAIEAYKRSLNFNKSITCLNNLVKTQNELLKQAQIKLEQNENSDESEKYQTFIDDTYKEMYKFAVQAKQLGQQESSLSSVYALINWFSILHENLTMQEISQATDILNSQSISQSLVFTILNFSDIDRGNTLSWLIKAEAIASQLEDPILNTDVYLKLGNFYEKNRNFDKALEYSHKSQFLAQSDFLYDSLFRSQWLAGRIYADQNNRADSIIAYQSAIASLDILNTSQKPFYRFGFNREIKPIYYELITLLLEKDLVDSQDILQALVIADKLKLSELQSFFGDDCFQIINSGAGEQNNSAIFSSIILEDKTYLVLQFPDNSIYLEKLDVTRSHLRELSLEFRNNLMLAETFDFRSNGEELYNLLIRPFEAQLSNRKFDVLTFVHDGILRNLPMSALYDGQKYVAEKWPSVSSIGINFTPRIKTPPKTNGLFFGLLESNESDWSNLNYVLEEVDSVHQLIGGKKYLNQDFSIDNLTKQLEKNIYSVVHLATHGYFSGNPEDSFVLAYDGKIFITDLEKYLRQQTVIDLLVLSACETSVSSDRALLGLAGVASRSGVKSTLGSFWEVQDDEQSKLIQKFYTFWQRDKLNKATALQKIQQEQIAYNVHPNTWAALNLIGSYD